MSEWVVLEKDKKNIAEKKILQGKSGCFIVRLSGGLAESMVRSENIDNNEKNLYVRVIHKTKNNEGIIYQLQLDYRLMMIRDVCKNIEIRDGWLYDTVYDDYVCVSLYMKYFLWEGMEWFISKKTHNINLMRNTTELWLSQNICDLAYMLFEESLMELLYEYFLDCCRKKFGNDVKFYSHNGRILCK